MPIRVFPPHYQLVYINFDISSFSLISYVWFSTKTQRYLLQNAGQFAAKYTLLTMFYGLNSK